MIGAYTYSKMFYMHYLLQWPFFLFPEVLGYAVKPRLYDFQKTVRNHRIIRALYN